MAPWTLEGELRTLFQADELASALQQAGLLVADERRYQLQQVTDWRRGGAETYIYVFDLVTGSITRRLVIKAFISLAAGSGRLDVLLDRRSLLRARGVATAEIYAAGRGMILEEYVPWSLRGYIRSDRPVDEKQRSLLEDLCVYAAALDQCRFAPLTPFSDLRTDGSRVKVVDFGEDLGGPNMPYSEERVVLEVGPLLRSLGCDVPEPVLSAALLLARDRLASIFSV